MPNTVVKLVEQLWIERHLLLQVRDMHPEFLVCKPELEAMMAVLSWFHDGSGRYVQKRSFQQTSDSDSMEQSLGFKLLLGTLLMLAHFLECPCYDSLLIQPAGSTAADNWMWEYITEWQPFISITTEDWDAAEWALLDDQSMGKGHPSPTSGGKKQVQVAYCHKLNW
ncbi:hypothetical protein LPJ61_002850, partial [Coemansia biformis]